MTEISNEPDFDQLLLGRGGAPSAKFPTIGSSIEGTLVAKESQPKRKYNPNPDAPVVYETYQKGPNVGKPIQELVVTLQTSLRDAAIENDSGLRRVFLSFGQQQELAKAVKAAGMKTLPVGTWIRIVFTHESPSAGGGNPRKEYRVELRSPADQHLMSTPATVTASVQTPPPVAQPQQNAELAAALATLAAQGIAVPGQ